MVKATSRRMKERIAVVKEWGRKRACLYPSTNYSSGDTGPRPRPSAYSGSGVAGHLGAPNSRGPSFSCGSGARAQDLGFVDPEEYM